MARYIWYTCTKLRILLMEITKKQKQKAVDLYNLCKSGVAPNHDIKKQLITLYNDIYKTKYRTNTNCGACLNTVFNSIKHIANK